MRGALTLQSPRSAHSAALPTPQSWQRLSHLVSVQVGPHGHVCVSGTGHVARQDDLPWAPPRHSGPAPVLCSVSNCALATLSPDPSADRRQGSPASPWSGNHCVGAVQYLSNLLLRGPLMGSIRAPGTLSPSVSLGPPGVL